MADFVNPIVEIISRLWTCCARHTSYLCKLQENQISLRTAMGKLKEARDDVQRRVVDEEEADPTEEVRGWLERVQTIEDEVEKMLQKANEQQLSSRGRCLGGCCPPKKCCSNYKLGKSIAKKIPSVVELKGEGDFQVLCVARPTNYVSKLQDSKILLRSAMEELKNVKDDVQSKVDEEEADSLKQCTKQVSGWLQSVENIEDEVKVIMQTSDEQLNNAECHEKYKLVDTKMATVDKLKAEKGLFQELCVARPTNYVSILQDSKILLRSAMEKLKNVKNDVQKKVEEEEEDPNEPKKKCSEQVRGWLQSVENIEGRVKVIMQTSDEHLNNAECRQKDKLVVMEKASVDELNAERGQFQELTYRLPLPRVEDRNRESPVGMESMFDEVWRLINNTDDKQPVSNIIGLYGPGGVGKTTLLEEINNEFKNKINSGEYGFDYVVIFVVVSKPVNYEAIQKKIGERLGLSLQEYGDEGSRAQKIFEALKKKNYVLLLDDIWENEFDKKCIGIPIHPQGNSKLIFTTRSEKVCGDMKATTFPVKCLPWDKAWSLFQDKVGENALNSFSEARELAKEVAKECGGLPLALITIGRAMSTKKSIKEWEDAKTTLQRYAFDFKEMRDKVLPRLRLSYDYLDNETEKSCFRYCALFPEDYSIPIDTLIDYWIAEGFLDGFDKLYHARNRGHTIIGSLKSACMLESSDGENHVKMHDVIRDLALWIVNDLRSSDHQSGSNSDNKYLVVVNDPCKKWENAERIFWDTRHYTSSSSSSNKEKEENPPTSPNLLTLIAAKHPQNFFQHMRSEFRGPQNFFQHMRLLRVLDLSNTPLYVPTPISICELHELQYLNLSAGNSTEFPVELKKLVKLKFLILKNFSNIPARQIANFVELQVLDLNKQLLIDWESKDGASFSELDGLEQLQEVRITITTDVDKFLCNRKLQMVCTVLKLYIPAISVSHQFFYKKFGSSSSRGYHPSTKEYKILRTKEVNRGVLDLSNFKSLKDLKLDGSFVEGGSTELLLNKGLLSELLLNKGLLSTLEKLQFVEFPKLKNIIWMLRAQVPDDHLLRRSHSQNLHEIRIKRCDALKDLTWVVYVENLKTLYVRDCKGLETIIKFGGDHGLEAGAEGGGGEGGGGVFRRLKTLNLFALPKLKSICGHALAFPSIETIWISECPELKKLPLGSGSNVENSLKHIRGEPEWWNELQWEDETIKSKFLPYLNKPIYDDPEDDYLEYLLPWID